jgi:uncharacterized membrane protein
MIHKPHYKTILLSHEGKILIWAFVLFFIFLGMLGYAFAKDIVLGQTLLSVFVAHIFGGRAAGVGLCIAFGMSFTMTIVYNMFLEVLIVFFCFSLFLISLNHYLNIRFIDRALLKAEKNAHKYQNVIAKYGLVGVFVFVLTPLPFTGPVVGSFIGHFLKFNLKKNFLTVFSGTLLAIVLWTFFFDFLSAHIGKIQWVFAIVIIMALVFFIQNIVGWFSKSNDEDSTGTNSGDPSSHAPKEGR